jgi:hypothetical protein
MRSNHSGASMIGVDPASTGTGSGASTSRAAAPKVTFS